MKLTSFALLYWSCSSDVLPLPRSTWFPLNESAGSQNLLILSFGRLLLFLSLFHTLQTTLETHSGLSSRTEQEIKTAEPDWFLLKYSPADLLGQEVSLHTADPIFKHNKNIHGKSIRAKPRGLPTRKDRNAWQGELDFWGGRRQSESKRRQAAIRSTAMLRPPTPSQYITTLPHYYRLNLAQTLEKIQATLGTHTHS